ncbi:beta strand repeat-containing protein [Dulcicalothrix desertica]|nr:S-layer family protein [Dulcicalothrix desertica]
MSKLHKLLLCGFMLALQTPAQAQITADNTLRKESSLFAPNSTVNGANADLINGGAVRGANLFHSFTEFNIGDGQRVYFGNPAGVQNIFTRVTGGQASNLNGTLGVNGAANLFLINPNGILFGTNARLDISGSFLGTTATSLKFADGTEFNTKAPQSAELLTVSTPIGLQFGKNPGNISYKVQAADSNDIYYGLEVKPSKTLSLVGGNISLESGNIGASNGAIEIGSVSEPGVISLTPTDTGWTLGYDDALDKGNILLSKAALDTSGEGGGSIQLQGKYVTLNSSAIFSHTLGNQNGKNIFINSSDLILENGSVVSVNTTNSGKSGDLNVFADNSIQIRKSGSDGLANGLYAQSLSTGAAGNLTINTKTLTVQDGGQISNTNFGSPRGGDLRVTASNEIQISGATSDTNRLFVSSILNDSYNTGATGNLTMNTGKLVVRDGARVITSTRGGGQEGNLSVFASDYIELSGSSFPSPYGYYSVSGLFSQNSSNKASNNLEVNTGKLIIRAGAGIYTSTASGEATISVRNFNPSSRLLFIASSFSIQDFTQVTVDVRSFSSPNNDNLQYETFVSSISNNIPYGKATNLFIAASDFIELKGETPDGKIKSGLFTDSYSVRDAGDLIINTPLLRAFDGARITVSSNYEGSAGNLYINASKLELDNSKIVAQTRLSNNGGNINLNVKDLILLRHNSEISTTAGIERLSGNGGNINVNAPFIIAVPTENSDITANAFSGRGGNVNIRAQSILGITPRLKLLPESDITASSTLGVQGQVSIQQPEVQPQQGLIELPEEVIDATRKVAQICPREPDAKQLGEFTITGRGSLPPSPIESLPGNSTPTLATLDTNNTSNESVKIKQAPEVFPTQIIEAQGWVKTSDGNIELIAAAPLGTPLKTNARAACPQSK